MSPGRRTTEKAINAVCIIIIAGLALFAASMALSGINLEVEGGEIVGFHIEDDIAIIDCPLTIRSNMPFDVDCMNVDSSVVERKYQSSAEIFSAEGVEIRTETETFIPLSLSIYVPTAYMIYKDLMDQTEPHLYFEVSIEGRYMGLIHFSADAVIDLQLSEDGKKIVHEVHIAGPNDCYVTVENLNHALNVGVSDVTISDGRTTVIYGIEKNGDTLDVTIHCNDGILYGLESARTSEGSFMLVDGEEADRGMMTAVIDLTEMILGE